MSSLSFFVFDYLVFFLKPFFPFKGVQYFTDLICRESPQKLRTASFSVFGGLSCSLYMNNDTSSLVKFRQNKWFGHN